MWKTDTSSFLSDHENFKPTLISSITQLAEKITLVAVAADLFVTSLWEHVGMRLGGFRIPWWILKLQNTMRFNVKIKGLTSGTTAYSCIWICFLWFVSAYLGAR